MVVGLAPEVCALLIAKLREKGVVFDAGLAEQEFAAIEQRCGIRFPPDLRAF